MVPDRCRADVVVVQCQQQKILQRVAPSPLSTATSYCIFKSVSTSPTEEMEEIYFLSENEWKDLFSIFN